MLEALFAVKPTFIHMCFDRQINKQRAHILINEFDANQC